MAELIFVRHAEANSSLNVATTNLLYEVPPIEFVKWLKENAQGLQKVLVVGHESHMSEFVGWCIARSNVLKPIFKWALRRKTFKNQKSDLLILDNRQMDYDYFAF